MKWLELLLLALNAASCAVVLWYALCALNAADPKRTPLAARIGFAAIACGAFAQLLHPPDIDIGGAGALAIAAGLAAGFLANRKRCLCLNCPVAQGQARANERRAATGPRVPG